MDPAELELQHPAGSEPTVLADPVAATIAILAMKISDPGRASRSLSFSVPHSRLRCLGPALVIPRARRVPGDLLLVTQVRFASAGDDSIIPTGTIDKIREKFIADSQGCTRRTSLRTRFSGWVVAGHICSCGRVRALCLRLVSSTWNRKAWYASRLLNPTRTLQLELVSTGDGQT